MVTGSRFLDPDGDGYRSSAIRRMGIRIFSSVVSLITGQRVTDPTSGFRMTNRRGIELFAHDYPHDYPEVEAILLMHAHRLRSCEIPVRMRPRLTGESAISSTQSVYYMVKVLLAVFVGLFRRRPTIESRRASGRDRGAGAVTRRDPPARPRDRGHARRCCCSSSSSCAASASPSATRSCGCWPPPRCSCWPRGRACSPRSPTMSASPTRPSALFAVAIGLIAIILLYFSLAVSRLSDQNKILAQRSALLQQRLEEPRRLLGRSERGAGTTSAARARVRARPALAGRRRRALAQPLSVLADRRLRGAGRRGGDPPVGRRTCQSSLAAAERDSCATTTSW